MAQQKVSLNGWDAVQPTQFDWSFETTSTSDSTRAMSGKLYDTPLFTVEAFDVVYSNLTRAQVAAILQIVVKRPSIPYFTAKYFSPFSNQWKTGTFSVSQGSLKIRTLKEGEENMQEISFRMVGRDKIV